MGPARTRCDNPVRNRVETAPRGKRGLRMQVDARDPADAAAAAVYSRYPPHPRYRSAATGNAGARVLPKVTVNRLNQDASGTLSPPASPTGLRWARGGRRASDCRDFGRSRQRSALAKPRTSQVYVSHRAP